MLSVIDTIERLGVVPVVAIDNAAKAPPLAEALLAGGLSCAEITFRTDAAQDAISAIASQFPEMLVGAGTVLNIEQAQAAIDAGVGFIVTPGFDGEVVEYCLAHGVPIFPGVLTPSEINLALKKGLSVLKFFPAELSGGAKMLKALSGPYGGVRFIPTGGVNIDNLTDYLALPQVLACGGSWLVKKEMINAGRFDQIADLAKQAVEKVQNIRSS